MSLDAAVVYATSPHESPQTAEIDAPTGV
jgi:hypothetical protein